MRYAEESRMTSDLYHTEVAAYKRGMDYIEKKIEQAVLNGKYHVSATLLDLPATVINNLVETVKGYGYHVETMPHESGIRFSICW